MQKTEVFRQEGSLKDVNEGGKLAILGTLVLQYIVIEELLRDCLLTLHRIAHSPLQPRAQGCTTASGARQEDVQHGLGIETGAARRTAACAAVHSTMSTARGKMATGGLGQGITTGAAHRCRLGSRRAQRTGAFATAAARVAVHRVMSTARGRTSSGGWDRDRDRARSRARGVASRCPQRAGRRPAGAGTGSRQVRRAGEHAAGCDGGLGGVHAGAGANVDQEGDVATAVRPMYMLSAVAAGSRLEFERDWSAERARVLEGVDGVEGA
ncbi:hypothetical protein GGX14DRAFT_406353 [Mycena pura]|uniref:Uncharacterized protein n=1 Tax=Mycena pura TaxID=153505 RepID=A0AAD6UQP9_9AGAR|nr:hypothetical protein GGX14DRAFT_406353 [Mycena pura]